MKKIRRVPWADVLRIRLLVTEGWKQKDIAKMFKISEASVSQIKTGTTRIMPHATELSDTDYLSKNSVRNQERGCLEWTAGVDKDGYGKCYRNKKDVRAHRLSWEAAYGSIPRGLFVCHHCDNPSCIELSHLFLGTRADNLADRDKKGRQPLGSQRVNAKLKEEDIPVIRGLLKSGIPVNDIAEMFSVTKGPIGCIKRNTRWAHVKESDCG